MIYSRYISAAVFVILLTGIILYDKSPVKTKIKYFSMTFLEGMVGGLLIDCVGVNAGYYYFPRQAFLSWQYFAIVIPCWGVFGLLINCLWSWLGKEKFLRGMASTVVPLLAFYEGSNIITGSWVYTVHFAVVALGWIPLIWVFAGCNRRRRVVYKVEEIIGLYSGECWQHVLIRYTLKTVRYVLVVIMFPLLLVTIGQIVTTIPKYRHNWSGLKEYAWVLVTPYQVMERNEW